MSHLDDLESQSIYLLREAFHAFERPAMLWSMGKDSNVLVWLAKKAFCGHVPFPIVHIDTTYEFPEMLEFRSWAKEHYGFDLIVWTNEEARSRGIGYETTDPVTVTHELKTVALQQCLAAHKFDALVTGIRRDKDSTRAKERYFSPRTADFEWDYKDQPPEFWNHFTTEVGPGRARPGQPLLDWTEMTSGGTSTASGSRSRGCTFRATAAGTAPSGASRSPSRSRAAPRRSPRSSMNSW